MKKMSSIITIPTGVTNLYLIRGTSTVLVDAAEGGKSAVILKRLSKHGIDPKEIEVIIITHAHWDHTGSLAEIVELTGATVLVHAEERERLETGAAVMPPALTGWGGFLVKTLMKGMKPAELPNNKADIVMTDNEYSMAEWGIPGKIIHTPGHTAGSLSIILENGSAVVGDMAMNGFPLRLSPGMPIFAECPEKISASWDRILAAGAKRIYPSHGKSFPAEKLKRDLPKES